jgi:hypothetical protein
MKQQFVITHTIWQSEIPALLHSSVVHKTITGSYISINHNMLKHWCINDLSRFFWVSPVKLCISGQQQIALSWVTCYS